VKARSLVAVLALIAACRPTPPSSVAAPAPRSARPTGGAEARFHLIDVGQGLAALVELPCGAALVDTGGETSFQFDSGANLRRYLDDFFARRADLDRTLDLLVLTHPHLDHTRNVEAVVDAYKVRNVVTGGDARGSGGKQQRWLEEWAESHAKLARIRSEDIPAGGHTDAIVDPIACSPVDPTIRVLWGSLGKPLAGWPERAFRNHNNDSVVVRFEFGRASFLVTGDLEEAGIEALLERHRGTGALDVDVWQVGHHGSYNATTVPLLEAMTPRIALIPMGSPDRWAKWTAWKFGHPRKQAIDRLLATTLDPRPLVEVLVGVSVETFEPRRLKRAIYGTGWDGHVVVRASATGEYQVETAHPARVTIGH
jgi:competence protein ComEC